MFIFHTPGMNAYIPSNTDVVIGIDYRMTHRHTHAWILEVGLVAIESHTRETVNTFHVCIAPDTLHDCKHGIYPNLPIPDHICPYFSLREIPHWVTQQDTVAMLANPLNLVEPHIARTTVHTHIDTISRKYAHPCFATEVRFRDTLVSRMSRYNIHSDIYKKPPDVRRR